MIIKTLPILFVVCTMWRAFAVPQTTSVKTTNNTTKLTVPKPVVINKSNNTTKLTVPKPIVINKSNKTKANNNTVKRPPTALPKPERLKKKFNNANSQSQSQNSDSYNEANEPWIRSQVTSSKRNVMNSCDCGKRNAELNQMGRIINGYNTMLHEYPWQTYLMAIENRETVIINGNYRYNFNFKSCGGSIINDLFILTAAHCLVDEKPGHPRRVKSASDIQGKVMIKNSKDKNAKEIKIAKVIVHPGYLAYKPMQSGASVAANRYDIALLKLTERLNLNNNDRLKPVCIPETGDHILIKEGLMAKVMGWGMTSRGRNSHTSDNLMQLNIPMHNSSTCNKYSGGDADRFVCGEELNTETGAAQGDSGGPLCIQMGTDPDKMIQIGVVSFTNAGSFFWNGVVTEKYSLGYYSDVLALLPFIDFYSNQAEAKWCQRRYSLKK